MPSARDLDFWLGTWEVRWGANGEGGRNVVTRTIGNDDDIDVDLWLIDPAAGDRYLICSDGLTDELEDHEIARVLLGVRDPDEAARTLVSLAGLREDAITIEDSTFSKLRASLGQGDDTLDISGSTVSTGPKTSSLVAGAPGGRSVSTVGGQNQPTAGMSSTRTATRPSPGPGSA